MSLLRRTMRKLYREDPDIFNVNNTPDSGFAVNIDCWFADVFRMSPLDAAKTIHGVDDYGNRTDDIPLSWTARTIFIDFLSCGLPLDSRAKSIPLGQLLHCLVVFVADAIANPAKYELEVELPQGYLNRLHIGRLVWLPPASEWSIIYTDKKQRTKQ